MATPWELALEAELNVEWQRFANQWLFPWHKINMDGHTVDVEDFRGGRITVGGIRFQGQIQTIFWQSLGRYLTSKVHTVFKRWETETSNYPIETRSLSLKGTEHLLRFFVSRIVKQAAETDRALRGRGMPESVHEADWTGAQSGAFALIERMSKAHEIVMSKPVIAPPPVMPSILLKQASLKSRLEDWHSNNKFLTWGIGILIAIILSAMKLFM